MRAPCLNPSSSCQGISAWFLLADCSGRSRRLGEEVQRMPEICKQDTHAGISSEDDTYHLAICGLGSRYGGRIPASPRKHEIHARDGGQVHEVDRGQADIQMRWTYRSEISKGHNSPIWLSS